MMLRWKVTCPLRYNEVEYTEEFIKLQRDGWVVDRAAYNEADHSVTFCMVKESE